MLYFSSRGIVRTKKCLRTSLLLSCPTDYVVCSKELTMSFYQMRSFLPILGFILCVYPLIAWPLVSARHTGPARRKRKVGAFAYTKVDAGQTSGQDSHGQNV
jgi:hypothetical protein